MRFLSLFAGIGGFDLGLESAGHECIGQVEIDPFCRRVLRSRFASVEQQADVRVAAFNDGGCGPDLLVGGFPCQDLSVAGKRAGLRGARSGLFWEIVRIAKITRPTWGLFENVPGLLSSRGGADMWTVLAGLRECWPVVGYRVLDSQWFGVPQRRRRVFFVCGPTEAGVRAVLFEPEGGGGNPEAGGEAGEGVAEGVGDGPFQTITARSMNQRMPDKGQFPRVVSKWEKNSGGPAGNETSNLVTHSLSCEGADASEDGTGRGTPLVMGTLNAHGKGAVDGPGDDLIPVVSYGVRRLTPLECERLQGFPDGWTCLCGTDDHELGCKCPDSPRYRALGNAVTVNVIKWIGERLAWGHLWKAIRG